MSNKTKVRMTVITLCSLLLVTIAFPGLVYARQVWSPFDHTIVALRDQYRFGGIWNQSGIDWFRANQQWLHVRWRYWWESETRAPAGVQMFGHSTSFYGGIVANSIVTNSFPEQPICGCMQSALKGAPQIFMAYGKIRKWIWSMSCQI